NRAMRSSTSAERVEERIARFPCSGEINRTVRNTREMLATVEAQFAAEAVAIEHVDGLSMAFADWRFNMRSSSTEPLARLNVESRGDEALMRAKTQQLLALMDQF
ncbi:MAG TPA: phosphomannomutase, partial [Cellvibrionaceae bacterium]|nr:phosphomannomutase [Cellvibrionaceae bacterium]